MATFHNSYSLDSSEIRVIEKQQSVGDPYDSDNDWEISGDERTEE